jgi:hypothetical protein
MLIKGNLNKLGQGVFFSCLHSMAKDDIEDSAELFIALFLYNVLIYTLFLRKVHMVSTKQWLWLDTRKKDEV